MAWEGDLIIQDTDNCQVGPPTSWSDEGVGDTEGTGCCAEGDVKLSPTPRIKKLE